MLIDTGNRSRPLMPGMVAQGAAPYGIDGLPMKGTGIRYANDVIFIAHARDDVRFLLDRITALEAEVRMLKFASAQPPTLP